MGFKLIFTTQDITLKWLYIHENIISELSRC